MPQDPRYVSVEYTYKSLGLYARDTPDQCPPYSYLNMLNAYERAENLMSTRYGVVIINRDPVGTGVFDYFFTTPVTTITKLTFQSAAYRYAGLADGSLNRRSANTQGAYTQIAAPGTFSGSPMTSIVTNCFQTSQPYIFFYDSLASLKDSGTFAALELTGIDPPAYTVNAQPYSPLLTLIDNFASGNSYTTSGFSAAWTFGSVTTIPAQSGQQIVDFSEFVNLTSTPYTPTTPSAPPYNIGTNINFVGTAPPLTETIGGFPSVATTGDTITAVFNLSGSLAITSGFAGHGSITYSYSIDGGVSWIPFYSYFGSSAQNFGPNNVTLNIVGLSNLNLLEFQILVSTTCTAVGTGAGVTTEAFMNTVTVTIGTGPGIFGLICNGILSNLNTNSSINVPITTVVSSGMSGGLYRTLTVTTQGAHGLTTGRMIAIYGASSDLVDGFYQATVTSATTFTVPYISAVLLSATGGFVVGGAATGPAECVLINEYSTPYPTQMSAWGFYQQVPLTTTAFPVGAFQGTVAANTTAKVGVTANFDLSINNQVNDADLIVLTLKVGSPANVANIRLQFDVNGSGYTSSYYYKDIAPAYYQGNVANTVAAYQTTQNQILADTLGLITGQPPATTTAQLQPGNFSTGAGAWVAVYIPRGNFLPVGSAGESGLDWTNITGWQIVITTNTTGSSTVAANGLYLQWGYGPSSFAGVGYDYRYTYYNLATGTESSPAPEAEFSEQFGYLSSLSAPIYLRQAVQLTGQYSTDPQVTHLRIYRRGGTLSSNWFQIDQVPNITAGGQFIYKDVIPDASLLQATPLILDNDPPVTSSLVSPIATTLSAATTGPGNTYYSLFQPQFINTSFATPATFVPEQIVDVGTAANLEQVTVITGGTDGFVAILRLQHNAGEPVNAYATPRTKCNLSALAYNRAWLAGDPTNPHYLYFSKTGLPENFSPAAYIPCGSPKYPITIVVNWRGTLFVATTETWYVIVNGPAPYAQPTGSAHGAVASQGWAEIESGIAYRAADGQRVFAGADGAYMTLPIEWIYRQQAFGPVPLADPSQASADIIAFYNNVFYTSYVSLNNSGQRYRLAYDCLPTKATALTRMGWKHHSDIEVGEDILAYDITTNSCKWTPMLAKTVQEFSGELTHWEGGKNGKKFFFDFTHHHKWAWTETPLVKGRPNYGIVKRMLRPADEIPKNGNLVMAAPLDESCYESILTPKEAAILGWIVTDGCIVPPKKVGNKRAARVHQAQKSIDIPALDTLLADVITSRSEYIACTEYTSNTPMFVYLISADYTEYLLRKCRFETIDDLPRIAACLNCAAATAMMDSMLAADGSEGKQTNFYQKAHAPQTEAFRILAVLAGKATGRGMTIKDKRRDSFEYSLTPVFLWNAVDCESLQRGIVSYEGEIWCPTTKFGTWICNYDGNISITGNTSYRRFRYDDLGATAMYWERDTNQFLIGIPVPGTPGSYCVAQDQVYTQDYDDGGWQGSALTKIPISLVIQTPYLDLGKPHFPKQFNVLEVDANTQNQTLNTTLLFQTEPPTSLTLATTTSTQRQKLQLQINAGEGYPAYSASIQHTMLVFTAPLLYQENVYAALLADYRTSYDTYWIKFNSDLSKIIKQGYFDYTSSAAITVELFADDGSGGGVGSSLIPYYTFTLPAEPNRESIRVLFPARKCRLWRLVATSSAPFQWWNAPTISTKPIGWGSTYSQTDLGV